ncbi:Zinc finger transcription factor ace1 [Fusarium albosuccineum]|uniref:Zinc finger transcription factor ace1 n=1 Tax=Fusarium albosuccineum TaxID=1237068 RepID=A0A8H4PC51_9HYPO|nr:Zinc finger transcription factor ace1 [Fusarium albosuccineum]
MDSISINVASCLNSFQALLSTFETTTLPDHDPSDISLPMVKDQLGRFKVWSANIGAHKTGRSSLDHRLRDASNIRNQVIKLLQDLAECLGDAKNSLTGETKPWDKEAWPLELEANGSDDSSDDICLEPLPSMPSELSQILDSIVEDINCLLRLSVSIRNPAPHDCFKQSALTDTTHFEPFDVQHVRSKFPTASADLVERLGRAISRRRQFFKYREMHHHKLASGLLDSALGTDDTVQSTVASSIPDHLKIVPNIDTSASSILEDDDASAAAWSETSYATSATNAERPRLPALPKEADSGPFECPFCFMIVSIKSRRLWKKHIFLDLQPYICVSLDCPVPDQDFPRRRQWANHAYAHHWKTWTCCFGCNMQFSSAFDIKDHLAKAHSETMSRSNLADLLSLCEQSKPPSDPAECPLCNESLPTFKHFQRHVGRHQEDLILFALPQLTSEETNTSDGEESEEGEDEDEADGQRIIEDRFQEKGEAKEGASGMEEQQRPSGSENYHNPEVGRMALGQEEKAADEDEEDEEGMYWKQAEWRRQAKRMPRG